MAKSMTKKELEMQYAGAMNHVRDLDAELTATKAHLEGSRKFVADLDAKVEYLERSYNEQASELFATREHAATLEVKVAELRSLLEAIAAETKPTRKPAEKIPGVRQQREDEIDRLCAERGLVRSPMTGPNSWTISYNGCICGQLEFRQQGNAANTWEFYTQGYAKNPVRATTAQEILDKLHMGLTRIPEVA